MAPFVTCLTFNMNVSREFIHNKNRGWVNSMKSRDLVRFSSLCWLLSGHYKRGRFCAGVGKYQKLFVSFEILEIASVLFWFIGVGMIFSVISQMGFVVF